MLLENATNEKEQFEKKLRELKTKNSDLMQSLEKEARKREEAEKKLGIFERMNQQFSSGEHRQQVDMEMMNNSLLQFAHKIQDPYLSELRTQLQNLEQVTKEFSTENIQELFDDGKDMQKEKAILKALEKAGNESIAPSDQKSGKEAELVGPDSNL